MALTVISLPGTEEHVMTEVVVRVGTTLPLTTVNLRIALSLSVEEVWGSGVYVLQPAALWAVPDESGVATFRIEARLRRLFGGAADVPAVQGSNAVQCSHCVRRYRIAVAELMGEPLVMTDYINGGSLGAVRRAYRGGLPVAMRRWRSWFGILGHHWLRGRPFLDWRGSAVRTSREQDQWLYFFFNNSLSLSSPQVFVIEYRLRWHDGTDVVLEFNQFTAAEGSVWMVPSGFTQLLIPLAEQVYQKQCIAYDVWVRLQATGPGTFYSEVKRFVVEAVNEFSTEVQYMNGLGCMTQVLLRGRPEHVTEAERSESEAWHELGYGAERGGTFVHEPRAVNSRTVASGYLTAGEMGLMRELMASDLVMVKRGNQWVRARVLRGAGRDDRLETARRVDLELAEAMAGPIADVMP